MRSTTRTLTVLAALALCVAFAAAGLVAPESYSIVPDATAKAPLVFAPRDIRLAEYASSIFESSVFASYSVTTDSSNSPSPDSPSPDSPSPSPGSPSPSSPSSPGTSSPRSSSSSSSSSTSFSSSDWSAYLTIGLGAIAFVAVIIVVGLAVFMLYSIKRGAEMQPYGTL